MGIDIQVDRFTLIKFLELVLTATCVGIHADSFNGQSDIGMLVTGTFVGYLIIFCGLAAAHLMKTPPHKRIDIMYSFVGAVLFVASGALLIDRYQHFGGEVGRKNIAKGSLAIINALVLLIDSFLTYRGEI